MSLTPDFIRAEVLSQCYEISVHADDGGKNRSGHLFLITVYIPTMPKWRDPYTRNR